MGRVEAGGRPEEAWREGASTDVPTWSCSLLLSDLSVGGWSF